ncbi:unnamed protein product [Miscanthus lutarioriparius]|uniref:cytokinin dehydrogenase n=1 Tax=Miscanthus lutarioriparius TaxID=422564 RepID=A0A811PJ16_9POAL|nr:unnamed protein product [Miscanthus lutarioriparius]
MMLAYMDRATAAAEPEDAGELSPVTMAPAAAAGDAAAMDFGGLLRAVPAAVVRPASADDVASAIRAAALTPHLTVAARGNGHSVAGQATAEGGLVLDMRSLAAATSSWSSRLGGAQQTMQLVQCPSEGGGGHCYFADVPGGALWEEVLHWGVDNHGLAPSSWTDYLRLTVGGTLSNGGVSGQSFRYGPQVSNVAELEVRWTRVVYASFADYTADAEWLVTRLPDAAFDYVEGFAFVNSDDPVNGWPSVPIPGGARFDPSLLPAGAGPVLYCLEVALYQYAQHRPDDDEDQGEGVASVSRRMMAPLKYVRGLEFAADVGYVDFLSRVNRVEEEARRNGSWDAPHPWLNLFVSARDIADFDRAVINGMLADGIDGPMLVYPMLKSKWDPDTSVALPEKGEIFYLVALLRFCRPGGPAVDELVAQNGAILRACRANGYDYKAYFPSYRGGGGGVVAPLRLRQVEALRGPQGPEVADGGEQGNDGDRATVRCIDRQIKGIGVWRSA